MVGRCRLVGRGGVVGLSLRVMRLSLVGDISNISVVVVSGVLDMLGPAIRKSNAVGSSHGTVAISSLSSVELGLGVVISNSILESIRCGLLLVDRGSMVGRLGGRVVGGGSRVVGGSMVDGRGMVDYGGMVDNRGVMDNRGMVDRGMVDNRGMVHRGMVGHVAGVSNNRSMSMGDGSMRADIRSSTGQANKSRNHESLK